MVCMEQLGMNAEQAAERTGVAPEVAARISARVAAVEWKHHVPHVL
jgi:hypothetical protein